MPNKQKNLSLRLIFAKNVRLVRINSSISQEDLGHECNLDRTFISSVERGVRNISVDNIEKIAAALRIDPRDLLNPNLAAENDLDETLLRSRRR